VHGFVEIGLAFVEIKYNSKMVSPKPYLVYIRKGAGGPVRLSLDLS